MPTRRIILTGLALDARIGILEHERRATQPLHVDAEFDVDIARSVDDHDIHSVLDYRRLREAIVEECTQAHVNLIETLVEQVAARLLADFRKCARCACASASPWRSRTVPPWAWKPRSRVEHEFHRPRAAGRPAEADQPAVSRRHDKARLEGNKLSKRLARETTRALSDYNMIEAGDKVMVCLSGGKDSYALLDILLQLKKRAPFPSR